MLTTLAAVSAALLLAGAEVPDAAQNPVATFLRAADVNDVAGMEALIDRRSARFLGQIKGCYLRRVYANENTRELIAAWMCAVGSDRSRVILANVGLTPENKVGVVVQSDMTNKRPAPERSGSALE
jgi:hypothetical protein